MTGRWAKLLIPLLSLVTLGSGVVTLASVLHSELPARGAFLQDVFPLEFYHLSRLFTVLLGFALVVASFNILRRKRGAYRLVLVLSLLGAAGHWVQGHDRSASLLCLTLAALLFTARKRFTVRSGPMGWKAGSVTLAIIVFGAILYGVIGFWLLDRRQFGLNFDLVDSVRSTMRFLLLRGDPEIVPRTRYAVWFLHSLYLMTTMSIAYGLFFLFRPVLYRYRIYPHERQAAEAITKEHGRSSLDFFKYWPDKSFYFSKSGRSFLAYRVGGRHAIVLGDPVGPEEELPALIGAFRDLCRDNDWGLAFHQALPDLLPVYAALGFHRLKIGDDAIVALAPFTLEGRGGREFRSTINRAERDGLRFALLSPPIADSVLRQCREVSDEWLRLPGRRERGFTLGRFDDDYLRHTEICLVLTADGRLDGFLNLVPCFRKGETTIDLMRRRTEAHYGVMDYLFIKLLLHLKEKGYERFNMGMAPMAGFQDNENATPEERAVHAFFQHLNFLFSFRGLRAYKAKFATVWEPRYLVFQNVLQLPAVAVALGQVSEIAGPKD